MGDYEVGEVAQASDGKLYRFKGGDPNDRANWEAADAAPPEEKGGGPGMVEGVARSTLKGATLGFGDEAIAGWRGLLAAVPGGKSPAEAVEESLSWDRGRDARFREDHPRVAFGSELAGGVLTGGAAGGAAKKGGLGAGRAAAQSLRSILKQGTATGALAGAGTADGDLGDRVRGAAVGGAMGAGFAGGVAGVAAPMGRGVARVGGKILDRTGLRPKDGSTLAGRTVGRAIETADERATRALAEAAERDDLTPDLARARAAEAPDKPLTISDIAGPEGNVTGLADVAKSLPGPAKRTISKGLLDRSEGELGRLTGDMTKRSGMTPEWVGQQADEIVKRRKTRADPLYAKLEGQYIKDPDETFTSILQDPAFHDAYKRAQRIARREGYKVPDLYDEAGNFRGDQAIPVRVFDYLNRGLRDATHPSTGMGPAEAQSIQALRTKLLGHVDELVPEFKEARGVFAGESDLLDALQQGAEEFTRPKVRPEAVRAALEAMTEGEAEMYRKGAIDALFGGQLGNMSDDAGQAHALLRTPNIREKVRLLFDNPADADAFMRDAGWEETMGQVKNRVTRGSQTAERIAGQADLVGGAPQLPSKGAALRSLLSPVMAPFEESHQRFGNEMSNALGKKLTAGLSGRGDLEQTIKLLEEFALREAKKKAAGAAAVRGGATAVGLTAGRGG